MVSFGIFLLIAVNGTFIGELKFTENDLDITRTLESTKIRLGTNEITDEVGAPELPVHSVKIALPCGARITGVEVLSVETKELAGVFNIPCVQPPVILSKTEAPKYVEPNWDIYLSEGYPAQIVKYQGCGIFDNNQICELKIYPVQYHPKLKKLVLYSRIKFAVHYENGIRMPARQELIKKLIINPEEIATGSKQRDRQYFSYLIITNPPMDTVFQRLADWKTKKGIPASVRTVNWILSHYTGEDSAAQLRNYIKLLPDSSVEYVLLGGDVDFIPCRFAYAMDCSAGFWPGREDSLPCDLYYADLQGDWDLDNDLSYGEIEDSIDLYPDLYIGRAPVNTIAQAQCFVNKVLDYEKNPEATYLDNSLLAAEVLWTDPYTDMGVHKNSIGDESFPASFQLTKLYQSLGNETKESVMAAIRSGQGIFNHDGHGWIDLISVGGPPNRIYIADFDTITNAPKWGILYSIGCWTSAFDLASVSEAYVNSPNGGGVAYIGNSSYGWGSPGNPGFGYSDRFDSRFFYTLFHDNVFHLGAALSLCKAHFIPFSREKNVYRWHQYQLNLLGDPEMPVWTALPETLIVNAPQSIPLGNGQMLVNVKSGATGLPIKNALVCLMKGTESYASAYTDLGGSVFLYTNAATLGNFDFTVTAQNHLPREAVIPVISGSYVNFAGWIINDTPGNNDGIANPNEAILLPTKIKNCGNAAANNIVLKLRSSESQLTIQDSTASYASLAPGDSVFITDAFAISIGAFANAECIEFTLEISDSSKILYYSPVILIGTPIIDTKEYYVQSPPSLPGQTESLHVRLENSGYGFAHNTWAQLTSFDPYLSMLVDSVAFSDLPPGSSGNNPEPFILSISPACPSSYKARLPLVVTAETYIFHDTLQFLVGLTGFTDDMESGTGLWTTGGTDNKWHISTRRAFSATHAWYCGDSTTAHYAPGMNCYIQTIPFMVQANSLLRFRRWFHVPLYGTDGIYVISMHNGIADTLDFIGTGGALNNRPIQSGWFEEKFSLSQYWPGDTIQLRIAFISDTNSNTGEGFYIDDVNVEYITPVEELASSIKPEAPVLQVFPNPFRKMTSIKSQINPKYEIPNSKPHLNLKIYDATGRLVKSFKLSTCYSLLATVTWHGDDDVGHRLPGGVYFAVLEVENRKEVKKIVVLR